MYEKKLLKSFIIKLLIVLYTVNKDYDNTKNHFYHKK